MLGDVDLERRLRDLGGAAGPGQLGTSSRAYRTIRRLTSEGRLVAHAAGCLALPAADPDIVRARQFGARLTCVSAARACGFRLLAAPGATHLAIPHRRGPALHPELRGVRAVIHREVPALLDATPHPRVPGGEGPLVVAPAEALARMLRCQEPMAAIVTIDSALNQGACTVHEIEALLGGPGSPAARAILAECDARSLSVAESVVRVTLRRAGLSVEPNCPILGVGYVDLLVEGVLVVECDGYAHHSSLAAFSEDRRRDRALHLAGYATLRFPSDEAARAPDDVLRCVLDLLGRARVDASGR